MMGWENIGKIALLLIGDGWVISIKNSIGLAD
jgi:hypothetical protein